jgi:hypothetical protein
MRLLQGSISSLLGVLVLVGTAEDTRGLWAATLAQMAWLRNATRRRPEMVPQCDLARLSYAEFSSLDEPDRQKALSDRPVVLTGFISAWPGLRRWRDPQYFSDRFGHHAVFAARTNYGSERMEAVGVGGEDRQSATVPLAEIIPHVGSGTPHEAMLVFHNGYGRATYDESIVDRMTTGERALLRDIKKECPVPEALECFSDTQVLSYSGESELET